MAVYAGIAGAKVAIRRVNGRSLASLFDCIASPRPAFAVCRDDHPFLAQRMPTLFPGFAVLRIICGSGFSAQFVKSLEASLLGVFRCRFSHGVYRSYSAQPSTTSRFADIFGQSCALLLTCLTLTRNRKHQNGDGTPDSARKKMVEGIVNGSKLL